MQRGFGGVEPAFSYVKIKKEGKGSECSRKKKECTEGGDDSRNPWFIDTVQELAQLGR